MTDRPPLMTFENPDFAQDVLTKRLIEAQNGFDKELSKKMEPFWPVAADIFIKLNAQNGVSAIFSDVKINTFRMQSKGHLDTKFIRDTIDLTFEFEIALQKRFQISAPLMKENEGVFTFKAHLYQDETDTSPKIGSTYTRSDNPHPCYAKAEPYDSPKGQELFAALFRIALHDYAWEVQRRNELIKHVAPILGENAIPSAHQKARKRTVTLK